MNKCRLLILVGLFTLTISCNIVPNQYKEETNTPKITPDYEGVTLPVNIAPLNFYIEEEASAYKTKVYSNKGKPLLVKGRNVRMDVDNWKSLLEANKGEDIYFEVYLKKNSSWVKYAAIRNHISADPIDGYVVYRYIQPLYTTYEEMSINQRNISNFDVQVLYDNRLLSTEEDAQCVNCHSFQDYNRNGRMQMHFRGNSGGTVIVQGDVQKKINMKTDALISAPVYPCWHPTMDLIAYSVNKTGQSFHTKDLQKVEVLDSKSDLVLFDVKTNRISAVELSEDWLETYPYWNPDGNDLYYSAARFANTHKNSEPDVIDNYQSIRYNIIKKAFDKTRKTFGVSDTVFDAAALGKSATLPRVSPDGKYLLFSMADYGNFHIWHKSSDLYLMDLTTRKYRNMEEVNSNDVESYHSWSSNGRWIIFTSRREDGGYSRLYISYFDEKGKAHKPFVLPQKDPLYYKGSFKSFNIPEFIAEPASVNPVNLASILKGEAGKVTFAR